MLTTYFTRERTRATYAAGPAGPYLDDFSHWLEQRGFTTRTIRRCLFGATQFTAWAEAAGLAVQRLDATSLEAFCGYLTQHDQLRYASGNPTPRCMGAHHFLTFLRAQGVTAAPAINKHGGKKHAPLPSGDTTPYASEGGFSLFLLEQDLVA